MLNSFQLLLNQEQDHCLELQQLYRSIAPGDQVTNEGGGMELGLGEAKPLSWTCGLSRGCWEVPQCSDGDQSRDETPVGAALIDPVSCLIDDGHQ